MTKKTVVETVYEYNSEGKMVKKTMTETVEYDLPYFQLPGYLSIYAAYGCPILGNSAYMYL